MGYFQKHKPIKGEPTLYIYREDEVGHEERVDTFGNIWDTELQALGSKYHAYINKEIWAGAYRSMFTCSEPRPYKMPKEEFIKKYKKNKWHLQTDL